MNSAPIKSSAAKKMREKIIEQYPAIEQYMEDIWPKSAKVLQMKIKGEAYIHFLEVNGTIKFMEIRERAILPTLKLLLQYPTMMNQMVCDKGAIKHIMSGSNVMAPGLTSEGGKIFDNLEIGAPVAIMAEGKKHAMGIGYLLQSSEEIKKTGKGQAIELIRFLNDQLWKEISI